MKTHLKNCLSALLGLALSLPIASMAMAQNADEPRDRNERQNDDGAKEDNNDNDRAADRNRDNRDAQAEDRDAAPANEQRAPRSVRNERSAPRANVNDNNAQGGSPSDLQAQPAPLPPQPMPQAQHLQRGYAMQNNCCCGNGGVAYSQNNGYRSAQMNNGGYRSYSYQGGDAGVAVQAAPAPVVYNDGYNNGYYGRGYYGGVQNGANWDRFNEHDSRNFSGSYGSRASLRSR